MEIDEPLRRIADARMLLAMGIVQKILQAPAEEVAKAAPGRIDLGEGAL
jgi:hypothetical protein